MKNADYWAKRAELLEKSLMKSTTEYEKEMMKVFKENVTEIEKDIAYFLNKYASKNGLTYAEASKNLTRIELSDYRRQVDSILRKYKKTGSPELLKRIEELEARAVLTRLDAMKGQIEARMFAMTEVMNGGVKEHLEEIYEQAYYGAGDDVMIGLDLDDAFHSINFRVPEVVTSYPYSGLLYSERIWKCTDKLALSLVETLQTGLVQGKSIPQMTKDLHSKLQQKGVRGYSNYDLTRIIRTETAFAKEQAMSDIYKKYGVEKYVIYTAKDERTCRRCADRHGEEHLESERTLGVNAPPFHPNCRCTTLVVLEGYQIDAIEE